MGQADDSDIGGYFKECSVVSKSASVAGRGQLGGPLLVDVGNANDAHVRAKLRESSSMLLTNLASPNDSDSQS
jgi:hypothetical protein